MSHRILSLALPVTALSVVLCSASARPDFEVASVKPAASQQFGPAMEAMQDRFPPGHIEMESPGRLRLRSQSLQALIATAYSMRASQVSGPAWIAEQRFDIDATVPLNGAPASR